MQAQNYLTLETLRQMHCYVDDC